MCRAAAPLTSRARMARNGSQQIANRLSWSRNYAAKDIRLGTTIDDAIGEANDKTARWLGLNMGRGGGPALEELAREGDAHSIKFSTPMQQHKDCNFSYAGPKTQVKLAIESKCINTVLKTAETTETAERFSRFHCLFLTPINGQVVKAFESHLYKEVAWDGLRGHLQEVISLSHSLCSPIFYFPF